MSHLNSFDVHARRREYYARVPFAAKIVRDERDEPIASLLGNVVLYLGLALPVIFCTNSHVAGLVHFVTLFVLFFERFVLALHFLAHSKVFKLHALNVAPEYVLAPLFGMPPGMYSAHHLIVHHVEGNVAPGDLSSTEIYQRDNILHFFFYWQRFLLFSLLELPVHAFRRQRYKTCARLVCASVGTVLLYSWLLHRCPVLAVWALIVPTVTGSFLLMLGNWSQHIFVNSDIPDSPYGITYDIINSFSNQKTFNDGYHTQHHLNSKKHWTELPKSFQDHLDELAKNDCIVFSGLSFIEVGMCVFLQRYSKLCQHFVDLQNKRLSPDKIEKMLRLRLRPVHRWKDGCVVCKP